VEFHEISSSGRDGEIIKRFAPITAPKKMTKLIESALEQPNPL